MKTLQNRISSPEKHFTVTKKEINNNKALLTNVLYNEMEQFVKTLIPDNKNSAQCRPKLMQLQILKNAYLKDRLHFKGKIIKLNELELHLLVVVKKNNSSPNSTICKAVFNFQLKQNISQAS